MEPSTIWLIILVVLVAGEAVTVGLTFIWFAIGCPRGAGYRLAGRGALAAGGGLPGPVRGGPGCWSGPCSPRNF